MAKFSSLSIIFLFLLLALSVTQLALARKVPSSAATPAKAAAAAATPAATATAADKKQTDCLQEGTVVIPGIGRYMVGSGERPALRGLDHSVPAAVNGQYLPGVDDTFVPNPGFEIPNPFRRNNP
ncbi:hypothetical protein ACMD2_21279 [Ananas comosus]|uniref:Cell wall protein n=1 Tax=Ananas comosus TaxID=4615 RepID=A0A199UJC7_ANACO|nr:hypothetical protein ACMD2_21279 [Ananas comosus]